jgi:hypothetical protein
VPDRVRLVLVAGILSFSAMVVYTQYVFLQTTDHVSRRPFRDVSLEQYHETLEGRRAYPFQWRVAGPWVVRVGEVTTGLDPHAIDVVVKVVALAASTALLMAVTALTASPLATVAAGALSLAITAGAYASEGYSIYYTNDFLMVAGWYAAAYLAARGRYGWVAAVTFLTAFAKETIVLAPLLLALLWWRKQIPRGYAWLAALAWLVPTAALRIAYPAPLHDWAWVGNVSLNIPFVRPEREYIAQAIRSNVKILLLFNVLWVLAYRRFRGTTDVFARSLVWVGVFYLAMLYVVVYLRELRHLLPLAVVVIPLAVQELERMLADRKDHAAR